MIGRTVARALPLLIVGICLVTPLSRAQTGAARVDLPSTWLAGYSEAISGQELEYHSPLPDVRHSLLVRSDESAPNIDWSTAPVPAEFDDEWATFVLLAGIAVSVTLGQKEAAQRREAERQRGRRSCCWRGSMPPKTRARSSFRSMASPP